MALAPGRVPRNHQRHFCFHGRLSALPAVIANDARHHGIAALPIDVNTSGAKCEVQGGGIRLGFIEVKGRRADAQTYSQAILMLQVLEQIKRFRAAFKVAEETTAVLDKMLELAAIVPLRGKQIHDVNIVATMINDGEETSYTYNVLDQMIEAQADGEIITYGYDLRGNRMTSAVDGETTTYDYDALNRLIEINDGSTLSTFAYDADGRRNETALATDRRQTRSAHHSCQCCG